MCSSVKRCDHVITSIKSAVSSLDDWEWNINEFIIKYNAKTENVTIFFEFRSSSAPGEIGVEDFLIIMCDWRDHLSQSGL